MYLISFILIIFSNKLQIICDSVNHLKMLKNASKMEAFWGWFRFQKIDSIKLI